MIAKGRVISVDGNRATIEIKRKPACSGCGESCGKCLTSSDDIMQVKTQNTADAAVGDIVELEASDSRILSYAALVFVLPIAAGLLLYFIPYWLTKSNLISYSVSGAGFIASLILLNFFMNRSAANKENFVMKSTDNAPKK